MNRTTERVAKDILAWNEARGRGRLLRKVDIIQYTGSSRDTVDRLTAHLQPVGGKTTYFYLDVAEALAFSFAD